MSGPWISSSSIIREPEIQSLAPPPDLLNQKLGIGPATCSLISPPRRFWCMRTTTALFSLQSQHWSASFTTLFLTGSLLPPWGSSLLIYFYISLVTTNSAKKNTWKFVFPPPKDKTIWIRLIYLDIYLPIIILPTLHNFINAFLSH